MKILLVQSYMGTGEPVVYPLGLACLKASLAGHEVLGLDLNVVQDPFDSLRNTVRGFEPDITGISLRNIDSTNKRTITFYYNHLKRTIETIRTRPDSRIVIGGSGFSMFAEEIMKDNPAIDYGLYLEGDRSFAELLAHLDQPEKVQSVFYRKDGAVLFSGAADPVNIDELPLPDRTILPVADYLGSRDALGVETKRGCALGCIYCVYGFLNGRAYRLRSPAKVADDIKNLAKAHGAERFTFVDSVFNIPKPHAEAICRELAARKPAVRWSAWFSEKGFSRELMHLAVEAGCDHFIFSPDGYSDDCLRELGKDICRADIESGLEVLKAGSGFEVSYNFFKNPPGQSLRNSTGMLRFCVRARRALGRRVHFEFSSLRIEPHTKLAETALREGLISEGESLLLPRYYSQSRTRLINLFFDTILRLKGK